MNKLREQIAKLSYLKMQATHEMECPYAGETKLTWDEITRDWPKVEKYWMDFADAIIALLQPRMLSKDAATSIYELITCGGVMDGGNFVNTALAKLKLIQEED